ncbi:MAG: NAD(P)-dependent oxidoreductase [Armatimonadetes bacterium]|nr:NAD(P)-dependent oxidoreductase [Armatimonadota bacterium]
MRIMVTGAGGAIGPHVVNRLLDLEIRPVILDVRYPRHFLRRFGDRADLLRIDVQDGVSVAEAVRAHEIDTIIHMAALQGEANTHRAAGVRVNILGLINMLEAARVFGVKRFVYCSTRSVYPDFKGTPYGHPTYRPVTEDMPLEPERPYDICKHTGERYGAWYRATFGVEFAALRFAIPLSPERCLDINQRAIGIIHGVVRNAVEGRETVIPQGGDQRLDLIYVKDLAGAIVSAATAPRLTYDRYNIGSGQAVSLREFGDAVRGVFPSARIEIGPGPEFAPGHYCVFDITRAREDLGFAPRYGLSAAVQDAAAELKVLLEEGATL